MSKLTAYPVFPVGTLGVAWGAAEKKQWLALQTKKRDYFTDVVSPLMRLHTAAAEVFQYGSLDYRGPSAGGAAGAKYPLYAVKSSPWVKDQQVVVVTGGVHGYETSGVHGALAFVQEHMDGYSAKGLNVLVLPCVSPWGYEHIQRWTPLAVDPNRQFQATQDEAGCAEATQAMACITDQVAAAGGKVLLHTDLHETTDQDNSEFRPSKFARDGIDTTKEEWDPIPDGFYSVGDFRNPQIEFHAAVIEAVKKVTHIADADAQGKILAIPLSGPGLIHPEVEGICGNHTTAMFKVTTEVYPDSDSCSPEVANKAQAVVIVSGIDYALAHPEGAKDNKLPIFGESAKLSM